MNDLRAFLPTSSTNVEHWISVEPYHKLIPASAAYGEKRLFWCQLEILLAKLRDERRVHRSPAAWRVRLMLEAAEERDGSTHLTLKELSSRFQTSERYLGHLFTLRTGITFHRYQRCLRVWRAVELLRDPFLPINEVARLLGHADPSNFTREFGQALGVSPSEFRQTLARGGGRRGNDDSASDRGEAFDLAPRFFLRAENFRDGVILENRLAALQSE